MAVWHPVEIKNIFMGTVPKGEMLLETLTERCARAGVGLGRIEAIGAVSRLVTAYYDQEAFRYETHTVEDRLEILSCIGNISLKEGKPLVHAHITAADRNGRSMGGHLGEGTVVFACEFIVYSFSGAPLERGLDRATGLPLWEQSDST